MIAIFAAMEPEVSACLGSLSGVRHSSVGGFAVVEGDLGVVCRTGLGRRAEEASAALLGRLSPAAVLSVGTAGALSHDLRAGEIVLCHRVDLGPQCQHPAQGETVTADAALLAAAWQAAEECGIPARAGRSVTVDSVAWGPEEKARLGDWMGHDIVEMESFWVGRAAAERGVPFLAVRVISDHAGDRIPEIPGLVNDDGSVDYSRLLPHVRQHPELVPIMAEQAERSRRAIESLRAFMTAFVPMATRVVGEQRPI